MCKVLNVRKVSRRPAPERVYVGRPSKWGNLRSCGLKVSAASVVKIAAELEAAITPLEKTNRAAEENKLPG